VYIKHINVMCAHVTVMNIVNYEYKFYIFTYLSKCVCMEKAELYN